MYLYTNEKAQKTAFLPIDVQKRRRRRHKKELFANYSASNYNTIVLESFSVVTIGYTPFICVAVWEEMDSWYNFRIGHLFIFRLQL